MSLWSCPERRCHCRRIMTCAPVNDMSALNEIDMTERLSGMDLSEQKLMSKIEAQNTDDDIKAKIEREFRELNANS